MKRVTVLVFLLALCLSASSAAATRIEIAGGWYGENLPDGRYAVLVPEAGAIATHAGAVAIADAERQVGGAGPLYLRLSPSGAFAGQSHAGLGTWEWTGGWQLLGPACGVSPVIYDLAGVLHLSDCSIGSQGWRYVADDGRLVTGDETYLSPALRLWEFTTHGDLSIGQSGVDGCVAVSGAERRQLEPGDCRFVRFNRTGNAIAVTMVKQLEHKTVLLWFTRGELDAFPPEPTSAPNPPPVPGPAPMPVPEPVPAPPVRESLPANVKTIRDTFVARFPVPQKVTPGNADDAFENECRAWVKRLAEQVVFSTGDASWGVKNAGGGRPQSKDSLSRQVAGRLINFDLLSGVGTGRPTLVPDPAGEDITGQTFMPVSGANYMDPGTGTSTLPSPAPAPSPTPAPSPDLSPILARLAALEQRAEQLERDNGELARRLGDLPPRPGEDRVRALIADAFARAVVEGKTERDRLGLQHQIRLGITVKQP